MLGKLVCAIIVFGFIASPSMECRANFCANGKECTASSFGDQDYQKGASQDQQANTKDMGHCLVHCSHVPHMISSRINFVIVYNQKVNAPVISPFLYQNPPIDSLERPPLAS